MRSGVEWTGPWRLIRAANQWVRPYRYRHTRSDRTLWGYTPGLQRGPIVGDDHAGRSVADALTTHDIAINDHPYVMEVKRA